MGYRFQDCSLDGLCLNLNILNMTVRTSYVWFSHSVPEMSLTPFSSVAPVVNDLSRYACNIVLDSNVFMDSMITYFIVP